MSVEKIFCLNLDSRKDRWEESEEEFKKVGYTVERVQGVEGNFNKGYYGALKAASKYKSSLILEDDVEFVKWDHLDSAFKQLPKDWDVFAIGCSLISEHKSKVSENIYRYENGWATHAIAYKKKVIDWMLKEFRFEDGIIFDEWIRVNVLPKFNCYVIYPMAAIQRASFSDIRNRFVDYTEFFKRTNENFK